MRVPVDVRLWLDAFFLVFCLGKWFDATPKDYVRTGWLLSAAFFAGWLAVNFAEAFAR